MFVRSDGTSCIASIQSYAKSRMRCNIDRTNIDFAAVVAIESLYMNGKNLRHHYFGKEYFCGGK